MIGTEEQVDKLLLAKGGGSPAHGVRGRRARDGSGKAYLQRFVAAVFLLLRFPARPLQYVPNSQCLASRRWNGNGDDASPFSCRSAGWKPSKPQAWSLFR